MSDVKTLFDRGFIYIDGALGTQLQAAGLRPGELPETWNVTHADQVSAIHSAYLAAGCDVITTNTFGANPLKLYDCSYSLNELVSAALSCAENARNNAGHGYIALSLGPTGRLLQPMGDLPFEQAVESFAATVRAAAGRADLIIVETMNDSLEAKAALLAAKENSTLPVFVTTVYNERERSLSGASPEVMAALLQGLGADAVGINCGLGPAQLHGVVRRLAACLSVPLIVSPNAGLPRVEQGRTVFDVTPAQYATEMRLIAQAGARGLGGCCGTTPAHIAAMIAATRDISPLPYASPQAVICSGTRVVEPGGALRIVGERINPSGRKRLKEALREGDMAYPLREAALQAEAGADMLDVNVGLPGLDEAAMLPRLVSGIQGVCELPLVIDTTNMIALEAALRVYNGCALINSVNGAADSMAAVFPLAQKYGGMIVALTLDENGVPATAEERLAVAHRIVKTAEEYGIARERLLFDALVLPISADGNAAQVTLATLRLLRQELGVRTILGVSNVSFGLPCRRQLGASFLTMAAAQGLDIAIADPCEAAVKSAVCAVNALRGADAQCAAYIANCAADEHPQPQPTEEKSLRQAVRRGLAAESEQLAQAALKLGSDPLALIEQDIIPALNEVGQGFEQGKIFLPQLLMSAEAASAACEAVRRVLPPGGAERGTVVLATVEGDVHDIGKNIVRLLLANYGYRVLDLGKDVPPAQVLAAVKSSGARLVGLSALMTTTVPSMQRTIELLREQAPGCRLMVGGAVLNEEFARRIGADAYGADAMTAVRIAEEFLPREDMK